MAALYGLREGLGDYRWRDENNASEADACVAFLTTKPRTGMGTMSTVNIFVNGTYDFVVLSKPDDADFLEIPPESQGARPVLVFWDLERSMVPALAPTLRSWLERHRPERLMFSGAQQNTLPGIEGDGAALFLQAMDPDSGTEEQKNTTLTGAAEEDATDKAACRALASLGLPPSLELAIPCTLVAPVPDILLWIFRLRELYRADDAESLDMFARGQGLRMTPAQMESADETLRSILSEAYDFYSASSSAAPASATDEAHGGGMHGRVTTLALRILTAAGIGR